MSSVWVKILTPAGGKNVHAQVNGYLDPEESLDWQRIIEVASLRAESLRLDIATYAISDKVELLLAWDKDVEGEEPHVFLPLNGRGRLDFDHVSGLRNTVDEGKTGDVILTAYPVGPREPLRAYFTLTLDFSRQGA